MKTSEILDVTAIEPRLKHPTIFKHFDALNPGEILTIHNDHDPKPLYYQLLGERGAIFDWQYLQEGPRTWLVNITKHELNNETNDETVGAIAAKDYRKAEVFKKLGIDFCCGGEKSLKAASIEAGISEELVRAELAKTGTAVSPASLDYNKWDLGFLADYIVNTHHQYIKENAPLINDLTLKVVHHHGEQNPELYELAKKVNALLKELLNHILEEESLVFPAIKTILSEGMDKRRKVKVNSLAMLIDRMHSEHDHTGEDLKYLRKITNNYTLPITACNSYTYLFEKLKEFEDDTFRHIHLENNILFPKSIALETT